MAKKQFNAHFKTTKELEVHRAKILKRVKKLIQEKRREDLENLIRPVMRKAKSFMRLRYH